MMIIVGHQRKLTKIPKFIKPHENGSTQKVRKEETG